MWKGPMKKQLLYFSLFACSLSLLPSSKRGSETRDQMKSRIKLELARCYHASTGLSWGDASKGLASMLEAARRVPELDQQVAGHAPALASKDAERTAALEQLQKSLTGEHQAILDARSGEHATALAEALAAKESAHATALAEALAAKESAHATTLADLQGRVDGQLETIEELQSRHGSEKGRLGELLALFDSKVVEPLEYDDGDGAPAEGSVAALQRHLANAIVEANGSVVTADDVSGELASKVVAAEDKSGRTVLYALALGAGVVAKALFR
jgi:hypothetical protein